MEHTLNYAGGVNFLELLRLELIYSEKNLENIMSISQAAKCIFRRFPSKALFLTKCSLGSGKSH